MYIPHYQECYEQNIFSHGIGNRKCTHSPSTFHSFSDLAFVIHAWDPSCFAFNSYIFSVLFSHCNIHYQFFSIASQERPSSLHTHTLLIASISTISCPELKDLVLLPVIHWFELGLWLNIPEDNLSIIEADNPNNTEACKRKMFSSWLKSNPEASYRQLVDALHTVGSHRMADQLCKNYGRI